MTPQKYIGKAITKDVDIIQCQHMSIELYDNDNDINDIPPLTAQFIADAINEKLEREKIKTSNPLAGIKTER